MDKVILLDGSVAISSSRRAVTGHHGDVNYQCLLGFTNITLGVDLGHVYQHDGV